jgi:hypothetical protein
MKVHIEFDMDGVVSVHAVKLNTIWEMLQEHENGIDVSAGGIDEFLSGFLYVLRWASITEPTIWCNVEYENLDELIKRLEAMVIDLRKGLDEPSPPDYESMLRLASVRFDNIAEDNS